jgi:hypothetical protein
MTPEISLLIGRGRTVVRTQKLHRPAREPVRSCTVPVGSTVRHMALDEAGPKRGRRLILSPVKSFFTALALAAS